MNKYLEIADQALRENVNSSYERNEINEKRYPAVVVKTVQQVCKGLAITPDQFLTLCDPEDIFLIEKGEFGAGFLRGYAASFAAGIQSGRIVFHPTTGNLARHGAAILDQAG